MKTADSLNHGPGAVPFPRRLVLRYRIVLKAAGGLENSEIAEEFGIRPNTVGLWRNRFAHQGLKGIVKDAPRTGRKPSLDQSVVSTILDRTFHEKPEGDEQSKNVEYIYSQS